MHAPESRDRTQRGALTYERTGYYALRPPDEGAPPVDTILLAVHGWGQSAGWFSKQFASLGTLPILVAAPQGPHQFYLDLETKKVGFNWLTAYRKEDSITDVNRLLDAVLEVAMQHCTAIDPKIYVLGFSQGSAMAWRYALHLSQRIDGIISCCADLPPDVAEALPDAGHWRTLLVYGTDDAIVPQEKIEEAQSRLTEIPWQFDLLEFEGGHVLLPDTVHEIGQWITSTLPE